MCCAMVCMLLLHPSFLDFSISEKQKTNSGYVLNRSTAITDCKLAYTLKQVRVFGKRNHFGIRSIDGLTI